MSQLFRFGLRMKFHAFSFLLHSKNFRVDDMDGANSMGPKLDESQKGKRASLPNHTPAAVPGQGFENGFTPHAGETRLKLGTRSSHFPHVGRLSFCFGVSNEEIWWYINGFFVRFVLT